MNRTRTYAAAVVGFALAASLAACGSTREDSPSSHAKSESTCPASSHQPLEAYRLLRRFDLSRNEGWQLDDGKPSNADGVDKPDDVLFGQGPRHTSMLIEGHRDAPGGTFYTGEARGIFQPIPNYSFTRAVVQFDTPVSGMWPAVWKRPLAGEGEIDDWEKFGGQLGEANEDHGTLHSTPYDEEHSRKVTSPNFPALKGGRPHVIETENAPCGFTWWVDGKKIGTITSQHYDDKAGSGQWASMFGNADKKWYFRITLQAGGSGGGPIPDNLMRWRFWLHELQLYVPR